MKQSGNRLPAVSIVVLVVVALSIIGGGVAVIGWLAGSPPRSAIQDEIDQDLQRHTAPSKVVNLNTLLVGEWKRALIVCGGTPRDLDRALGFDWNGPNPEAPGFLSMLVLADDRKVLDYFAAGQDDMFVDQWYFTVCTVPVDPGYSQVADTVITVNRDDAQIEFQASSSSGGPFWYVSSSELLRLKALEHSRG